MLARSETSQLGQRLREGSATIGEVMAWLSALYFRGKLLYATAFGSVHPPGALVMTPGKGLRPANAPLTARGLREMGDVDVETAAFVGPLRRDAERVSVEYGADAKVVLLGSIGYVRSHAAHVG